MHAVCLPRRRGAAARTAAELASRKVDRLDLLTRTLNLRSDCVSLALSSASSAVRKQRHWNELHDQADTLARHWALADPADAHRLLPSLLSGLDELVARVEAGYFDAINAER